MYGQNFEIFKFSAASETHFKSIFKFRGDKSDVCGLGHSGSQPFNSGKHTVSLDHNTIMRDHIQVPQLEQE